MMPLFVVPGPQRSKGPLCTESRAGFGSWGRLFSPTFGINISVFGVSRLRLRWLGDGGGEAPGPGV